MKKITLTALALLMAIATFAKSGTIELTDNERQFVENNSDFAFRLFRKVREGQEPMANGQQPSLVLSPLSITYALGMLNNGATGETQQQINTVLGSVDVGSADVINSFCRKMIDASNTLDEKTKVLISDNIYVNSACGFHLLPEFVKAAADYYDATPETRDFFDGETRDVINKWASDHTEGMIKEPLKEDEFNPNTISYLLNALYFKSEWKLSFDQKYTQKTYFDGEKATAEMMQQYETFMYAKNDVCQSIQLPYGNGAFQMTVFLPRYGKTIDDLLAKMSGKDWNAMAYEPYIVYLLFPRFETDTDQRLEKIMAALGMPRAFDSENAQFDKFAVNVEMPDVPIYIDMMKQVAKICVNESGTEAAAVTIIDMKDGADYGQYAEFIADRPFLYVISERSTGTIFFVGQYTGEPVDNPRHNITLTAEEKELVTKNNDFAFRLFREARNEQSSTGNPQQSMILSPLSITYALGMLNNGAAGQTQQEINQVLGSVVGNASERCNILNNFCRKMLDETGTLDKETKVLIGNTVFVNEGIGIQLQDGFVEKANTYYDAEPQSRDFADGLTRDVINQWGSDHTNGMIKEVLSEPEFNEEMASYLLNALYFKGTWTNKFKAENTKKEPFNGGEMVDMMHQNDEFVYMENDLYQAVRLPYGNEAYVMTVFLPREGKTVGDLLENLNGDNWHFRYGSYIVDLALPRFETSTNQPLKEIMKRLGMPTAFDMDNAEFPYFCNEPAFIDMMKQVAKIEVNEEGTEAAAITIIGVGTTAMPRTATFHADRPFFYIISEQSTNTILFMGQYVGNTITGIHDIYDSRIYDSRFVYDLQGRKIVNRKSENRQLNRGLYIRNGKKFVR
jgi:serine protease inhibitor